MSVQYKCSEEVVMKATQLKAMITKVMTVGLIAGALALGPVKAEAQSWGVGVQIGTPAYGRDYYARLRYERERRAAFERQQAWLRAQERARHEAWLRQQRYYDHHYYRR